MKIANPIYDVVFKYLLDDNKIAKKIISLIIGKKIRDLKLLPSEFQGENKEHSLTVYRVDFSAEIRLKDGSYMNVIIEIQKAKLHTDIMRFRKYLGNRYADPDNSYIDKDGTRRAIPILSIYFLGHNLGNIDSAIIEVERSYRDKVTKETINNKNEFIESLTHDSYIIQIPKLNKKSQNKLEKVLSVFDSAKGIKQFIEIEDKKYPEEYKEITRRLKKAAAEPEIRKTMDIEDEFLVNLEDMERTIEVQKEKVEKAEKRTEEATQRAAEECRQKEEERRQKEEAEKEIKRLKALIESQSKK